jgi:WD40 repeat protein
MKNSERVLICLFISIGLMTVACEETQPLETTKEVFLFVENSSVFKNENQAIPYVAEDNKIAYKNHPIISKANVEKIALHKNIFPFFPPVIQLSSDGKIAAVGDLSGIKVININSNETLLQVNHPVPKCNFGFRKYFQLNYNGSYLAIALSNKIEVWSVDGRMIFESPYENELNLDPLTCGGNIPQMALSPDGKYLAESGVRYSSSEVMSYFRVTDIASETIIYEKDGNENGLSGQFYTYPGLGFSLDGNVLATFDPKRFSAIGEKYNFPFRYFSTINWEELAPSSKILSKVFEEGDFLFARSEKNSISIFDKRTGKKLNVIPIHGCVAENPCNVIFSSDGKKIAVRQNNEVNSFKRISLSTVVSTYEILTGKKNFDYDFQSRSYESFVFNDLGELTFFEASSEESSEWWTYPDYFSGFRVINEKSIAFTPQVVFMNNRKQSPYTGSCALDMETFSIECSNQLFFENGFSVGLEEKGEGITVFGDRKGIRELIADIRYPHGDKGDHWQFRLLNYSVESGIGFFCVDRNLREDSCFIMDLKNNKILHEGIDLTGIQNSPANHTSVFIDQNEKALFLFLDENKSLKKLNSYQATALPVKPVYLSYGIELIYLVQSVGNNKNAYIERIDSNRGKVIKRYDIEEIKNIDIKSIAVSPKDDIWAIADENGIILFIIPEEQEEVFRFQAMDEEIVDMIFSKDGKSILTIGRSGLISIWVVET